jgi:exopolysaccharide biosynthesis protein
LTKELLKKFVKFTIPIMIAVSLIIFYAGHFSFSKDIELSKQQQQPIIKKDNVSPVVYKHFSTEINGHKQEINILEIKPDLSKVEIKPVLSFDSVFGFEKLSSIAARTKAYAVINAGFFTEHGSPSGMVVIGGKIITKPTGVYPVLVISDNKATLKEINMKINLICNGKTVNIDNINAFEKKGEVILYTPEFGTDNRAKTGNVSVTIVNNQVVKIARYEGKVDIPKDGVLLTFYNPNADKDNNMPFIAGDKVEFKYDPFFDKNAQCYECGSWIVKAGKVVIGARDSWVGVMTNYDPRTAVGIKDDGTVVLFTVDGRQPGFSVGLTGKELGEYLLNYGINNAAMLDGGASTEMIIEGKIVNTPSFKGQERPLGGGILIQIKD